MTPFEKFFAENYPDDVDELWKKKLAACWNAALHAVQMTPGIVVDGETFVKLDDLEILRSTRVTP